MKAIIKVLLIAFTIGLHSLDYAVSATKTWSGNTSTDWNNSGNWVGGIIADSSDNIVINSNAPNNLILTQNQKITNLTINGDTVDLGGYTFEITGTAYFNGGLVKNGLLKPTGSLCHFGGATLDARIEATCGYFHMNSGVYKKPVFLTSTGAATTSSTSGNHFEDSLTITNNGAVYFNMGSSGEDIYDGPVILYNYSSKEIRLAATDTSYFNNHVSVNASSGGVEFGASGGVSILASGKTISVGTFSSSYLTLTKFIQLGSTAQTLTLSGTGVVSLEGCVFNGNLTINAPGILTKNSTYNGNTTFNRTGSATNFHSYGSNVYAGNVTWDNAGSGGRVRLASTAPDTYMGDATFSSTGGQDLQVAYVGDNTFAGNITINSNKVVFNTSTGKVTFTGTSNQTLNGSYNYPFKKLAINKSTGTVTANTTLSVDDSLIFILGNLITTSSNLLTMKHGSTATGASNSSFVSGPLKKIGNAAFVFNVGSGSTYRPLTITTPSNTTDAFTAEYYNTGQTLGNTKDTTITFVSDCGYWKLDRNVGSSNITPKFAFDSLHCDYLTVKPVHIALWNGTKWTDKGEAVTESTNKTTSSAMSSFGYFAFAYDLKPGDAPQMPYPLTIGSACSYVELQFTSNDIWFSFTPDSAVVKGSFTSPDTSKTYAFIKRAAIYQAYQVGDTLQSVSIKTWPFDSTLVDFQNYVADLTPDVDYLLKVSKFDMSDGPGIHDTIDYFVNLCLFNLRMLMSPTFHFYDTEADLINILGTLANPNGITRGGDVVLPGTIGVSIDLTTLTSPLLIEEGVTFCGDYDLLSESFDVSIPGTTTTITTSPTGTLIYSSERRGEYIFPQYPNPGLQPEGYLFYMMPGSIIRNIRLKGPMPGFQDYNFDNQLCAGIRTFHTSTDEIGTYDILHCEIYNFSYAGIDILVRSDEVTIDNCYIHHISGAGGYTSPKGYGIWSQGNIAADSPVTYTIQNNIFDDSKEGIDISPNPTNATIEYCTFGDFFGNENITRHKFDVGSYNHPAPTSWTPPSNCFYNSNHEENSCSSSYQSLSAAYLIPRQSAGNLNINKCVFHQSAMNISSGYPTNPNAGGPPIYNIDISKNTFAKQKDPVGTFASTCGKGGYARMDDTYIEECTWEYERNHNILGQYVFGTGVISDPKPILTNAPNAFSYTPGAVVNNSTSPQPPEVDITFDAIDYVSGYSPNTSAIPYYSLNDNIEISLSHGNTGSQSQHVTYIVRAKVNEGGASGSNASGNNAYNNSQYVTLPQTSVQTLTNTQLNWTTDKPGLYGIDAYAVDGNYTSTSSSTYLTSKLVHKPVIIKPATNYMLTFNIKDSYYSQLNATSGLTGVKKQVELNGNVIWQEDISQGGDDWEYVMINIDTDTYTPPGASPVPIKSYLNGTGFQNEITFSIAITNPGSVNTSGSTNLLKGVRVWVDDVYLKKYDSAQNLITDGDVENSEASELTGTSTPECIWYRKNQVKFAAYHLDYTGVNGTSLDTGLYAITIANLNSVERKSGFRAIQLNLPPLKFAGSVGIASNYGVTLQLGTPGANGEFISAAVKFDIRDFYDCDDVADILDYTPTPSMPTTLVSNEKLLVESSWLVTSSLTIANSDLLFKSTSTPINITVANGGTLTISGDETDSTYMGGCKMWDGIKVEPGGHLIIDGMWVTTSTAGKFVKMEDAITAVSGIGNGVAAGVPQIDLNNIVFNKNIVALHFENDNFSSSSVFRSLFKCDGGFISKDANNPIIIPEKHIYLESATNLTIGGGGQANVFQDVLVGIEASKSDVITFLCEFNNLIDLSNFPAKGYGIVATNVDPATRVMDVSRTRFSKLHQGISTTGNYNISIDNGNIDYFREIDDIAISLNCMNYNNNIDIKQNKEFLNCNIGIKISGSNLNDVTISDNTFNNTGFVETQTSSFHNTAITVQMPFTTARLSTNVEIIGNSITDYRIGIHGSNIQRMNIIPNATSNLPNEINFNLGATPSIAEDHIGIWLQNCPGAIIKGGYDPAATSPVANIKNDESVTGTTLFKGIDITSSANCRINCNFVENIPISMRFYQRSIGTILRKNKMEEYDVAVYIDNAEIGPQKQINSSGQDEPTDNEWHDLGGSMRVDGTTQTTLTFKWHRDPTSNAKFIPDPYNILVIALEDDALSSVDCDDVSNRIGRDELFGKAVDDSLEFIDNIDENKYIAKLEAYQAMKNDTTIIYQSTSRDTVYIDFFNSISSTNIALFDSVLNLSLDTATIGSAITLNTSITDTNDLEYYRKSVNTIYLNTIAQNLPLDAADSSFCDEVSELPFHVAGDAIFSAAVMIGKEIHPQSVAARMMSVENPQIAPEIISPAFNLVPNPTSSKFHVQGKTEELKLIQILSSEGKTIKEFTTTLNKEIPVEELKPGIYYVKLTEKSGSSHFLKLVIVR